MKIQGKVCKKCGTTERYDSPNKRCVKCVSDRGKKSYKASPDKHRMSQQKYKEANKEKHSKQNKERYRTDMRLYVYHMLKRAEVRAKKLNIPFKLIAEDIEIPEYCPILGIKLEIGKNERSGPGRASPSLDRIVPDLGYINSNVVVISQRANQIKTDASIEEIDRVLSWLRMKMDTK